MVLPLLLSPLVSLFSYYLLGNFVPQFSALLAVILIFLGWRHRVYPLFIFFASILITLFVLTTGAFDSMLFFLLYFLIFAVAFFYPPNHSLTFTLILTLVLAPFLDTSKHLITLSSLFFVTPLALIFSQEHLKILIQQEQLLDLRKANTTNTRLLARQETTILLWLTLNLRPVLVDSLERLSNLQASLAHFSPVQKTELLHLTKTLSTLLTQAKKLTTELDKASD